MRIEHATRCMSGRNSLPAEVVTWRKRQLVADGFTEQLAARVAATSGFDLHGLLNLVDLGCPPELAVRILEPLTEPGTQA